MLFRSDPVAGRSKNIRQSELDEIPGIGAARKRALLNHFGSARGVKMAGLVAIAAVPVSFGIRIDHVTLPFVGVFNLGWWSVLVTVHCTVEFG